MSGVSIILRDPAVRQNSIRVLVADDYPPLAFLLAEALRHHGYEVREVHDGGECLRIAESFRPHALIADVSMKDLDGFQLASIFGLRFPKCRVLLVSADPYLLSDSGQFKVAVKPIPHETLFEFLAGCEADV